MKFIKKSFLVLSLLSAFSLSSLSANACTVKVGDFDWDSANIHTAIGSYIMEHGYGSVSYTHLTLPTILLV